MKSGNVFHYRRQSLFQKKGLIAAKAYQINIGGNVNMLCLQAFNLAPNRNGSPTFDNSLFDRCRQIGK